MANTGPPVVMRQEWRDLLFVHWEVPVETLRPLIPDSLDIDTFGGNAYVGLVPFGMHRVRPVGLPAVPWLSDFLECNVRTYVRHGTVGPGVWFFSLEAAQPVAVAIARTLWHLPYHHARMSRSQGEGRHRYETRRIRGDGGARFEWTVDRSTAEAPADPHTLEHFLIERYTLFARTRHGIAAGRVRHAPYRIRPARLQSLDQDLVAVAGIPVSAHPALVHASPGVVVDVEPLRSVRG